MEVAVSLRPAPIGTQYRQGDILLVAQARLPTIAEPILEPLESAHRLFLSVNAGPTAHSIQRATGCVGYRASGGGALEWLEVIGAPVILAHPEHAPLALAPGVWRIIHQREYDPATMRTPPHCD